MMRMSKKIRSAPSRKLVLTHGQAVIARPPQHRDVRTVAGVFAGLGKRSRRYRLNGPKPCLSRSDLRELATMGVDRHAIVPVGIARLVRHGSSAEVAVEVVDRFSDTASARH